MIITEKIFDIQTGEETVIEREETADEQKSRLEQEAFFAQEAAEIEIKNAARASANEKLEALGLTTEEIAALTK